MKKVPEDKGLWNGVVRLPARFRQLSKVRDIAGVRKTAEVIRAKALRALSGTTIAAKRNRRPRDPHPIIGRLSDTVYIYDKSENLNIISPDEWLELESLFKESSDPFETLERFSPAFDGWIEKYHALIDVAEKSGYAVRPIEDYIENRLQPYTLYLYHDVHAWDIIPALGLAKANKERDVCSTFYLLYDYSTLDQAYAPGYRIFSHLVGPNVKVGLHASPFSSWLRLNIFGGDDEAFENWCESEDAKTVLRELLLDERPAFLGGISKEEAEERTMERLSASFYALKEVCPSTVTANHHGDPAVVLMEGMKDTNRGFTQPGNLLSNSISRNIGILASPRRILIKNRGKTQIFNETKHKESYLEDLAKEMENGKPLLLINHPAAFSNDSIVYNVEFANALEAKPKIRERSYDSVTPRRMENPGAAMKAQAAGSGSLRSIRKTQPNVDPNRGIYLSGFARGGTTWARRVFGAHPDIYEVPGQVSFNPRSSKTLDSNLIFERVKGRLSSAEDQGDGIETAKKFVTKAPPNSEIMADMMDVVPDAKFLFIMRDPRDVLISHQRTGVAWTEALSDWDMAMRRTAGFYDGFVRGRAHGPVHCFRYEDLHQRFPSTFEAACEFLGVEVDRATVARVMRQTSFAAAAGGREHKEKTGQHKRSGVISDWARNLYHADALAFKNDPYWQGVLEEHGYGWDMLTLAMLLDKAKDAGIERCGVEATTPGLRIVWSLADAEWDYPELLVRRLEDALTLADRDGYGSLIVMDDGIDEKAVEHLKPIIADRPLGIDVSLDSSLVDDAEALKKAVDRSIRRTRKSLKQLDAKATHMVISADQPEIETRACALARANGFVPISLSAPESEYPTAVLREIHGVLTAAGPDQSFDMINSATWSSLRDWVVTLHARPLANSVSAPLALGFRSVFADLRQAARS